MGQQQLLLILLTVILVGLAIVIGIVISNVYSTDSNRTSMISELNNMGSQARKYYLETTQLGGGNQSFTGWTIPPGMVQTGSGNYTATVTPQMITIVGTGIKTGNNGVGNVQLTNYITFAKDSIVINN